MHCVSSSVTFFVYHSQIRTCALLHLTERSQHLLFLYKKRTNMRTRRLIHFPNNWSQSTIPYSSSKLQAMKTKYRKNMTSARPTFIFHLKTAMEMMTKSSMRKRSSKEQAMPELLTWTGPKKRQDKNHGRGRLKIQKTK